MFKHLNFSVAIVLVIAAAVGLGVFFLNLEIFKPLNPLDFGTLNLASLFSNQESNLETFSASYTNPDYGFSFQYPEGVKINEFDDEGGRVILGNSFQIFITPFDEPGPITAARIRQDLPDIVMENPTETKVSEIDAISFIGEGGDFKTAEVWFVYPPEPHPNGNYLYQLTAKLEDATLLEQMIATWKFD